MAHHKRGRARRTRAGCKMCKPWKINGYRNERAGGEPFSDHRRREAARRDMERAIGEDAERVC